MVKRLKVTLTRLAYLVLIVFLVMSIAPGSARAARPIVEVNCTTNDGYNLNLDNGTTYKRELDKIQKKITDGNSDSRKTKKDVKTCFLVPVSKYGKKYVDFIVRSRDLYILGFRAENNIYTFNDQDPNITPVVPGTQKVELPYGGNYNSIYPDNTVRQKKFGSENIIGELNTLKKATATPIDKFKTGLAYGAFFLSESLRFKPVNTTFVKVFNDQNTKITFNDELSPYVLKWGDCSQAYLFGTDPQKESARKLLKTANGNMQDPGTIPTCPEE